MYKEDKPDSEEYLLGKRIDKHVEGEQDKKEGRKIVSFIFIKSEVRISIFFILGNITGYKRRW